ncbi:hypothetical protein [Prosthecochloris sp.]|uniref:hypothetical protein n=1 Tax=Prosthecochloris sp. TaxID=290513 RepID=UPI0025E8F373|nr:hypothetical protein [Prosthecochloris sp.]
MAFIDELKEKASLVPLKSHYVAGFGRRVYFKPTTPHETAVVKKMTHDDDPAVFFMVNLVVLKALDENGKRLFKNADAEALRKLPFQPDLTELASKMQERISVEDAEGNSDPNQN